MTPHRAAVPVPGATNDLQEGVAHLRDACNANAVIEAETVPSTLGTMIVVPRKAHEAFGKKKKLTAPQAQAYVWWGTYPAGAAGPYMDTTKTGTDYKLKK